MADEFPMEEVTSSNVSRMGFQNGVTRIVFKNSKGEETATWEYWPMTESDYNAMRFSGSIGSEVHKMKMSGLYSSKKVS